MGFNVDDLLVTCKHNKIIDVLVSDLREEFREVKEKQGNELGYLGMRLKVQEGYITVDMDTYTDQILSEFCEGGHASTPLKEDCFEEVTSTLLPDKRKDRFHSCVAKLLYMAKRTRPDLLLGISYLASRVQQPTSLDEEKLARILRYLNNTKKVCLVFTDAHDINIKHILMLLLLYTRMERAELV